MAMVLVRVYSYDCDAAEGCTKVSEDYVPPGTTRRFSQWARRAAISDGWVFLPGDKTLCPAHAHLAEGMRKVR